MTSDGTDISGEHMMMDDFVGDFGKKEKEEIFIDEEMEEFKLPALSLFDGLHEKLHLLNLDSKQVLETLDSVVYNGMPECGYVNPDSQHSEWRKHNKYYAEYQGMCNTKGQLDGLGIRITPGK